MINLIIPCTQGYIPYSIKCIDEDEGKTSLEIKYQLSLSLWLSTKEYENKKGGEYGTRKSQGNSG
jgi:NAD(P)H-flavin reductase